MKKIIIVSLAVCLNIAELFSQGTAEEQTSFRNMRSDDFTKLTGVQEGAKLNYNSEKTNVDGSAGFGMNTFLLQLSGSLGTTTNLTDLFDQKLLPTYAGSVTLHYLIPSGEHFPGTMWFYDKDFEDNYDKLKDKDTKLEELPTIKKFKYRDKLRYKLQKGAIKKGEKLYTFKRFFWLSFTTKFDNAKYSFFDSQADFSSQLREPRYQSAGCKLTVQYYLAWNTVDLKWRGGIHYRPTFFYINGALYRGLNNNISQLKKTTVEDVTPVISNTVTNVTRQTIKSTTAYNGQYKQYVSTTASWELIFAPFKSFAINIFGEKNFIKKVDKKDFQVSDYSSIAVGIYFFNNTKPSSINFGVYSKWTENHTSKARTNQIGLKATIPITPL